MNHLLIETRKKKKRVRSFLRFKLMKKKRKSRKGNKKQPSNFNRLLLLSIRWERNVQDGNGNGKLLKNHRGKRVCNGNGPFLLSSLFIFSKIFRQNEIFCLDGCSWRDGSYFASFCSVLLSNSRQWFYQEESHTYYSGRYKKGQTKKKNEEASTDFEDKFPRVQSLSNEVKARKKAKKKWKRKPLSTRLSQRMHTMRKNKSFLNGTDRTKNGPLNLLLLLISEEIQQTTKKNRRRLLKEKF